MDPKLLKILVCPVCKRDVKLKGNELICVNCSRRYPIVNGIAHMLPDELR
ncbi:MAG: Trm112 family protein [Hadesarchaea archaeon]|nr:Trm112 family protein [Hadesarchaea archaeon]